MDVYKALSKYLSVFGIGPVREGIAVAFEAGDITERSYKRGKESKGRYFNYSRLQKSGYAAKFKLWRAKTLHQ